MGGGKSTDSLPLTHHVACARMYVCPWGLWCPFDVYLCLTRVCRRRPHRRPQRSTPVYPRAARHHSELWNNQFTCRILILELELGAQPSQSVWRGHSDVHSEQHAQVPSPTHRPLGETGYRAVGLETAFAVPRCRVWPSGCHHLHRMPGLLCGDFLSALLLEKVACGRAHLRCHGKMPTKVEASGS